MFLRLMLLGLAMPAAVLVRAQTPPPTISIRAARVLDGRGGAWENAVIEVAGSQIAKIEQRPGPVTYDLGNTTVLPGLIDVHVHMLATPKFGPESAPSPVATPPAATQRPAVTQRNDNAPPKLA